MTPRLDRDARKTQLAQAVWQVILDHGISAVSVRNVAEQAGVVVGSLRHVFPTRAELIQFSAELMLQRATERVQAVPFQDDRQAYALDVIEQLLPLTEDSRAEFEVNLALMAEAPSLPELLAIRDETHEQLQGVSVRLVELLTDRSRDEIDMTATAQRLHALIDGLAFHLAHQPPTADVQWALDIIKDETTQIRANNRKR